MKHNMKHNEKLRPQPLEELQPSIYFFENGDMALKERKCFMTQEYKGTKYINKVDNLLNVPEKKNPPQTVTVNELRDEKFLPVLSMQTYALHTGLFVFIPRGKNDTRNPNDPKHYSLCTGVDDHFRYVFSGSKRKLPFWSMQKVLILATPQAQELTFLAR